MKKTTLIFGTLLIVALIVVISIFSCSRKKTKESSQNTNQISDNKATKVLDEEIISPKLVENGEKIIYFVKGENKIKTYSIKDGKETTLYSVNLNGFSATETVWSDDGKKALLFTEKDGASSTTYSFSEGNLTPLDEKIVAAIWADEKLLYCYKGQDDAYTLNLADWNGKNWKKITNIDKCNHLWAYQSQNKKAYFSNIITDTLSDLYLADLNAKSSRKIIESDFLFLKPSLDGQQGLLATQGDDGKIKLSIIKLPDSTTEKNLEINAEMEKMAWSQNSKNIFFAGTKEGTSDQIFSFSLVDGSQKEIGYQSGETITATNLIPLEKTLYFTSNNKLYQINL